MKTSKSKVISNKTLISLTQTLNSCQSKQILKMKLKILKEVVLSKMLKTSNLSKFQLKNIEMKSCNKMIKLRI